MHPSRSAGTVMSKLVSPGCTPVLVDAYTSQDLRALPMTLLDFVSTIETFAYPVWGYSGVSNRMLNPGKEKEKKRKQRKRNKERLTALISTSHETVWPRVYVCTLAVLSANWYPLHSQRSQAESSVIEDADWTRSWTGPAGSEAWLL